MDNEKLLGIIGALFVELEVKRGELKKSKEDEKQAVDNSEFWMDRSKEKDIEIKKLNDENSELQALSSGLNEFIAKGKSEVVK